jgi:hypothetical protein
MTSAVSEPTQSAVCADGQDGAVSQPAPAPVAAAVASRAAVLLALLVVAAGGVGIREALVDLGWIGGSHWLRPAVDVLNGLTAATWMVGAGTILGALGIAMMVLAVLPRRDTALPLSAQSAVYLERADVAKLADAAARGVPGVLDARSKVSRRKAVVRCRVTSPTQELPRSVTAAVSRELDMLQTPPRVVVRIRTENDS